MEILKKNYFMEATKFNFMGNFDSALRSYQEAKNASIKLNEYYKHILNAANLSENLDYSDYYDLKNLLEHNENDLIIINGYTNLCLGQSNILKRNPAESIINFREAKTGFEILSKKENNVLMTLLSEYANSMEIASEGYEEIYRLNHSNAKLRFKRAQVSMDSTINKFSQNDEGIVNTDLVPVLDYIKLCSKIMESYYHLSSYRDLFARGDFTSAADEAQKLIELDKKNIESSKSKIPENQLKIIEGDYHFHLGEKYLIDGELMREMEKWEEALNFYKKARSEWENSSNCYLESGFPQAFALQETANNNSSIVSEVYIRNCKKEKILKEEIINLTKEISDLKNNLSEVLKRAGVTVNNTQEMISTVEQNVHVVQKLENSIRENIENIVKEFEKIPVAEGEKTEVKNKADEVLNSREQGDKFIEKAKKFTKDVREIVENVGEIAKPVSPYLSFLTKIIPIFI